MTRKAHRKAHRQVAVDWEALESIGLDVESFRNGCCPEMAYVIRQLIPNSEYVVGTFWSEDSQKHILCHCVVWDGETTWDAEGDNALRRWDSLTDAPITWIDAKEDNDFFSLVIDHDGSVSNDIIKKITPHVSLH